LPVDVSIIEGTQYALRLIVPPLQVAFPFERMLSVVVRHAGLCRIDDRIVEAHVRPVAEDAKRAVVLPVVRRRKGRDDAGVDQVHGVDTGLRQRRIAGVDEDAAIGRRR
jgi:hypothetical protein